MTMYMGDSDKYARWRQCLHTTPGDRAAIQDARLAYGEFVYTFTRISVWTLFGRLHALPIVAKRHLATEQSASSKTQFATCFD